MPAPYLDIQTPDGRRQLKIDDKAAVTIGRHPENILVVTDPNSSRRHCVIEKTPTGWRVRDLNSSNGTRINGQVVEQSRFLPGDIVSIGQTRITLVVPTENEPEPIDDADIIDGDELSEVPEEIETLSEDDIVEVVDDEDAPLAIDVSDMEDLAPVEPDRVDMGVDDSSEQTLRELAQSLPDQPFGEYDIATINARGQVVHPAEKPGKGAHKREAVDILRLLLLVTARSRATDIHMEPKGEYFSLRIRIDGSMVDVVKFPNEIGVKLNALVKIMCDIDVTQKSIVQEGHFVAKVPGRRIDYRVSFAPSVFGQKLVIRVQDTALAPVHISDLNLPDWMLKEVEYNIEQDSGMILVCGPTGSGKTTTLYSLIRSSDTAAKNFVTIEDPVEIQIEGVTQIPVDEAEGKTFSALLRSVLRQDPDAIMVGEIRDPETARIAMQAAITGHMVFSTVHTTNTLGTIFRLLDLGVEPYLIAQGLHLVLAQRLVRQLCPYCKKAVKPTPEQLAKLPNGGEGISRINARGGCARCLSTGFWGRRAFFELLHTSEELRDVIVRSPTMGEISKTLANTKFEKLSQSGYQLVADGVVSFDEIEKAVGR